MIKKSLIAYCIFFATLCYIIWPWIFEKKLLFNELLSLTGIAVLMYKRFRFGKDLISICLVTLLIWSAMHAVVSLFRMDKLYYYFRNLVIAYSMMTFFIGYYLLRFLGGFIDKAKLLLRPYFALMLLFPVNIVWFERFGTATLFPALFKNIRSRILPLLLVVLCIIQAVSYDSSTAIILGAFYLLIFLSPGYRFFKQVMLIGLLSFILLFIYLLPYLDLIKLRYDPYNYVAIYDVINSHPILSIDGNSTWRLVFWKQIIVDHFPQNLFGLGFGTPMMKYYPVEDFSKIDSLPYIFGAHNSYVYLFGRLGIVYVLLMLTIYSTIFKEYFYFKTYFRSKNQNLIFLSFFAISIISLFNPTLESPIFAGGYWLILGLTARAIHDRQYSTSNSFNANLIYS